MSPKSKSLKKYAIGIDLGGQSIKGALVNQKGKIIKEIALPTESTKGPKYVFQRIVQIIKELTSVASVKKGIVLGACIATPGLIDSNDWIVRIAPNLPGWVNIPLRKEIQKYFNFPVYLENDANAAAYGEKWVGAGKNVNSLIVLTLGTGIGGGIISNGKIFHGADGSAGEPGHINLFPDGLLCNCGNHGCLEAHASALGITKRTQLAIQSGRTTRITKMVNNDLSRITPKIVHQAAVKKDKLANEILEDTGKYIGIAIMSLVNLLNPEMVVLGGGVMKAGNYLLIPAKKEFRKRGFQFLINRTTIVRAKLGNDAGRIGAAGIVFMETGN